MKAVAFGLNLKLQKIRYKLKVGQKASRIPTHATIDELLALHEIAMQVPPDLGILEIGTHLGATLNCLGAATEKVKNKLFAVDTWNNETMPDGVKDTFDEFLKNCKHLMKRLKIIRIDSKKLDTQLIPHPIGLIFIDGDHSYEGFQKDFEFALKKIVPGGVIACHDFCQNHPGVTRVISEAIIKKTIAVKFCAHHLIFVEKIV